MYISGVPGTGKTATVKRVIDSLNADLLMKHSFKVILNFTYILIIIFNMSFVSNYKLKSYLVC